MKWIELARSENLPTGQADNVFTPEIIFHANANKIAVPCHMSVSLAKCVMKLFFSLLILITQAFKKTHVMALYLCVRLCFFIHSFCNMCIETRWLTGLRYHVNQTAIKSNTAKNDQKHAFIRHIGSVLAVDN